MPVAGQHAFGPDCTLAQRIALVWATISDGEQLGLFGDDKDLLALVPDQPAAART